MNTTDQIHSREEFVAFVRDLSKDFRDNNATWDNDTVELYLDALAAWVADMDGYYKNTGESAPIDINWKFIAMIINVAKYYE